MRQMARQAPAVALAMSVLVAGPAAAEDLVRLGNVRYVHFGAISYMKELGPKYGLKIEQAYFPKGLDVMAQFRASKLDVGATATDVAIKGWANGSPIYIVAGFGRGAARLVARADAPLASVKALKGKRVGALHGAAQELLLYAELVQHGMTWSTEPGEDVRIVLIDTPVELNKALESGAVDAISQSEPYASAAIGRGFAKEILKPYDTILGEPIRSLSMTRDLYDKNPDLALRILRCFVEATRRFVASPELAERYVREDMFGGKLTHEDWVDSVSNFTYAADMSVDQVQATAYFMVKYGAGKLPSHPIAADFVRLGLLEKAKKDAPTR